jgi:hypothetical protein
VPDTRYRCAACGNLTRFDVERVTRTRSFHHYSVGGELTVENTEVLTDQVIAVQCRWCGPAGNVVELSDADEEADPVAANPDVEVGAHGG